MTILKSKKNLDLADGIPLKEIQNDYIPRGIGISKNFPR